MAGQRCAVRGNGADLWLDNALRRWNVAQRFFSSGPAQPDGQGPGSCLDDDEARAACC